MYSLVDPVEVAPKGDFAYGDFFEVEFDQQGRLGVVYTRCTDLIPGNASTDCDNSEIYFARTFVPCPDTAATSSGTSSSGPATAWRRQA